MNQFVLEVFEWENGKRLNGIRRIMAGVARKIGCVLVLDRVDR